MNKRQNKNHFSYFSFLDMLQKDPCQKQACEIQKCLQGTMFNAFKIFFPFICELTKETNCSFYQQTILTPLRIYFCN